MTTLIINVRSDDSDLALAAFPLMPDQYFDGETSDGEIIRVEVNLNGRGDTTTAQEQYLNTNPAVVSYEVR